MIIQKYYVELFTIMLFTCVKDVNDTEMFGETSKLFEAIDGDQLQEKLMETMNGLNDAFQNMGMNNESENANAEDVNNNKMKKEIKNLILMILKIS